MNFKIFSFKNLNQSYWQIIQTSQIKKNVESGFKILDKKINGLKKQQMYVLGSRPGIGKTTLSINIINNIIMNLNNNDYVVYVSLEMGILEILNKLICLNSEKIFLTELNENFFNNDLKNEINFSISKLENKKLILIESNNLTIDNLKLILSSLKEQNINVSNIFIDYIQLFDFPGNEPRHEKIAKVSKNLRVIAKEQNLNMFVLSQLSREIDKNKSLKPTLSDLKDSGSIEQDADVVFLLWEQKNNEEEKEKFENKILNLTIAKNRNGVLSNQKIDFNNFNGKMVEQ